MTDDEKQPSEDVTPEDPGTDGSAAGPVAEEGTSSSQAAGDVPSSTPPADDASEAEQPQDEASEEEQPKDEAPEAEQPQDEASEEEQAKDEAPEAEQPQDEASEEEQAQDEAPVEEPDDAPAAEQEEDADAEETSAEAGDQVAADADEGSQGDSASADGGGREAEQPAVKKKDVIPGADLEPIAVESSEARPLSAEERARKEAEEEERAQREAALTGDGEEEESPASRAPAKMESGSRFQATGKRKRSIARVTLLPGDGKFEINGRGLEEFFPRPLHQTMAKQPLTTTGYETTVDVRVRVHGGGIGGQAGAVRHGISRALTEIDPELRGELKRRGFLTRDARVKERRKAGLKKARKKPQFSKR
jgi:small subunit ribosomal protein S9